MSELHVICKYRYYKLALQVGTYDLKASYLPFKFFIVDIANKVGCWFPHFFVSHLSDVSNCKSDLRDENIRRVSRPV